jgi:hypothetical protein
MGKRPLGKPSGDQGLFVVLPIALEARLLLDVLDMYEGVKES